MPSKRWQYGVRYPNGTVEAFPDKRSAKAYMLKGDKLVRRFVGKWRDA